MPASVRGGSLGIPEGLVGGLGTQGGREVVERSICVWLERRYPVIIKGFWNSLKTEENRDFFFAGVSSWEKPQTKQISDGLQQLLGNISHLLEEGKVRHDGEEA